MMHTIYTWGYAGARPPDLAQYLTTLGAALVDIRYTPHSRLPGWEREHLRAVFGARYHHIPALGNRNHAVGGPIQLAAPAAGIAALRPLLAQGPVVLLCACYNWATCHRAVAADLLAEATGAPIVHLPGHFMSWRLDALAPAAPPADVLYVLTGKEPWWSLLAWEEKEIETRTFRPPIALPARIGLSTSVLLDATDRELMHDSRRFRLALERHGVRFQPRSARYPHILDPIGLFPPGHLIATAVVDRAEQVRMATWPTPGGALRVSTVECLAGFEISDQEHAFGNYRPGRWLWFLRDVQVLPTPIPVRGALGLWRWPVPAEHRAAFGLAPALAA